ncbi:MAG: sporulation protein YunB [Bacillota bacterium]|nr:sporulation protein YunB [Bacillota bacterium]
MRRCKRRIKNVFKNACFVLAIFCAICSMTIFAAAKFLIEPNLENVARIRAEAVVSRTINKALAEEFAEKRENYDLIMIKKDASGTMDMVQADSMKINLLKTELSVRMQEKFKEMEEEHYEVPVGSLFGSKMFSQLGPSVLVRIIPMTVSSMDFRSEFETQGINQTKYRIYIEHKCRVRVLAPFSSETFDIRGTIPIAEAVILGEVPHSFVQVPKEDILDVTEE